MNPITYLLLLALMFKGHPYYSPPYYMPAPFVDTYVQQTPVSQYVPPRYILTQETMQSAGPGVVATNCRTTMQGKMLVTICP